MSQSSEEVLFYNFIKNECRQLSIEISEQDVYALSNDLTYKMHQYAQITKSVIVKGHKNSVGSRDVEIALNLMYKNPLIVKHKEIVKMEANTSSDIKLKICSKSVSNENLYKITELTNCQLSYYQTLVKTIFDQNIEVASFHLKLLRESYHLNDIIALIIININEKIETFQENEEGLRRVSLILYEIVRNPYFPLSENPMRDVFITLVLKLLWSETNIHSKLQTAQLLNDIINRQYLQKEIVRKMLINTLFLDFDEEFHSASRYRGSLIGLIAVDLVCGAVLERLTEKLCNLSSHIRNDDKMKDTVAILLCAARQRKLIMELRYSNFVHLLDKYFSVDCAASIVLLTQSTRPENGNVLESRKPILINRTDRAPAAAAAAAITDRPKSVPMLRKEIEMLMEGKLIDDINKEDKDEEDDCEENDLLPPVLFRKNYQTLSSSRYSLSDYGLPHVSDEEKNKILQRRKKYIFINYSQPRLSQLSSSSSSSSSLAVVCSDFGGGGELEKKSGINETEMETETKQNSFYFVFLTRRVFVENSNIINCPVSISRSSSSFTGTAACSDDVVTSDVDSAQYCLSINCLHYCL